MMSGMALAMERSMTWAVAQCKVTKVGGGAVGL